MHVTFLILKLQFSIVPVDTFLEPPSSAEQQTRASLDCWATPAPAETSDMRGDLMKQAKQVTYVRVVG